MKLLRSFPVLTFALVLLSILGLCIAQHSLQMLLVAGTLAALSWYITEGPRGKTLPRWVSNILVITASIYVFADLFQNRGEVMGVLGRFAIWLTLIKLYERRTARDHAHLLTLSLLLMMTGCLQSNDLLFGIVLLLYAALGLYVLLLYQLYAAFEQSRNVRQKAIPKDYRLVPPLKPIIGRHASLQFRTQALGVALSGVALSIVVFVMFPRDIGVNMLGVLKPPATGRVSQFAWEIDLNVGGRINQSRLKAFALELTDIDGRPIRRDEPLLLRGAALDEYRGGGRWEASRRSSRRGRLSEQMIHAEPEVWTPLAGEGPAATADVIQRFWFYRNMHGPTPLFSIYAPVAVLPESSATLTYDFGKQLIRTSEGSSRLLSYSVKANSKISEQELVGLAGRISTRRDDWFSAADSEQLRNLARSVLLRSGVRVGKPIEEELVGQWNRDAASALTRYLQSEGGYSYTLELGDIGLSRGIDPIVHFIFSSKRGHCEYFASALAALCHAIEIPARVVTGYVASSYDEAAQQYIVLESSAHAWVEVAVDDRLWATFDPTPPGSLDALGTSESTLASTVRDLYHSFEGDWSANVVGFDGVSQSRLADSFSQSWSSQFSNALDTIKKWMERVNDAFYFGPAGYLWMGLVAFALVVAIIALVKLMRRSRAIKHTLQLQNLRGSEYQRMLRQLGFYLDMLHVLKRGGHPKPVWQPPLQFAQAIERQTPTAAELVRRLTATFYAARYGRERLSRNDLEHARSLVQQLASALHVRI